MRINIDGCLSCTRLAEAVDLRKKAGGLKTPGSILNKLPVVVETIVGDMLDKFTVKEKARRTKWNTIVTSAQTSFNSK